MTGKDSIKKIISEKIKIILFSFTFLLFSYSSVHAVNVSNIEINPSTPAYGEKFDCIFTVDYDESMLACDMLRLDDPDTTKPWDICPKRDDLGHRYTSGNQRFYHCVADQSTGVPGPGTYRIVAWRFYSDGMYGDVIAQKEITIREKPLPTSTPRPSNTPIPSKSPTPRPTYTSTPIVVASPTLTSFLPTPTSSQFIVEPTLPKIYPTVDFYPIHDRPLGLPSKTTSGYNIGAIIFSVSSKIGKGTISLIEIGKGGLDQTSNFLIKVISNFIKETSF